jgi:hypothetical protein
VYQVVVLPPDGSMTGIEELRRLHDPAFHRIGAHVALLPPFDGDADAVTRRFDGLDAGGAFELRFGAPAVVGDALCLPVADGEAAVRALRARLAESLLGPLGDAPTAAPSLRVGLFGGDAEIELARRSLGTLPPPAPWSVREIVLLVEDVRGLWHEVRRKRLDEAA